MFVISGKVGSLVDRLGTCHRQCRLSTSKLTDRLVPLGIGRVDHRGYLLRHNVGLICCYGVRSTTKIITSCLRLPP